MEETKEQIINLINEQDYGKVIDLFEEIDETTIQDVIKSISKYEIQAIFGGCSNNIKEKIINAVHNTDLKENLIEHLNPIIRYRYIQNNRSVLQQEFIAKTIKVLLSYGLDNLKKKILFEDKNIPDISNLELHQRLGKKFVKENIEDIVKLEFDENAINQKLELLKQIEKYVGDNIYLYMDFKILSDKYVETIGIDGIINIALNNIKQSELFSLDETRLKILSKCLNNNPIRSELDTYKDVLNSLLLNFSNNNFSDLMNSIDNINNLSEADIKIFQKVLQKDNIFEIRNLDDLRNFKELKKRKCDEWIKSDDIEKKRLAIFEKIFGQNTDFLNKLQMHFSHVEEIKNCSISQYIKCIREILRIDNPKLLEEFYNTCTQTLEIDDVLIKKEIQKEYGKLFNEGLFTIEQGQKIGENIYEAVTDFKMIVHCRRYDSKNYFDDWNRDKSNSNDYFCASYIRNDMIATYEAGKVLYGFNELEPESICGCTATDGGTVKAMKNLTTPNNLINSVKKIGNNIDSINCYNEINYKRFSNVQRQQPSYIVVFRINGEIDKKIFDEAKKAQKQWNNELPIVVVDVNKCIEAERKKVEEMKKEYAQTKSPILAKEIYNKIKNNQATIAHHKGRIKTTFFEEEIQQYIVSDEEIKKYTEEHKEEQTDILSNMNRPKTKIEKIYDEINNIISKKDTIEKNVKKDIQKETEQVIQDVPQVNETQQFDIEITPKDIAKLDQERKITTTKVKRNPLVRLLNKIKDKRKIYTREK